MFQFSRMIVAVKEAFIRSVALVWPCAVTDQEPVAGSDPGASAVDKTSDSSTMTVPAPPPLVIPTIIITDYDAEKAGLRSDVEWQYKNLFLNEKVGEDPKSLAPAGALPRLKRQKRVTPRRTAEQRPHCGLPSPGGIAVVAPPTTRGGLRTTAKSPKICPERKKWGAPRRTAEQWPDYGPLPDPIPGGFVIVAPPTTHGLRTTAKMLKIPPDMFHYIYTTVAKYTAQETYRPSHEGMSFISKFYGHRIHDQRSYDAWLGWKAKRPAEERVLWVVE
ncbi:hypothetical protein JB92DRAFT_3109966 [Gautieria morchelliformis]|nr:hypothetical protein JB92DRAFT_3109966 [Gautieria morchelliformis]